MPKKLPPQEGYRLLNVLDSLWPCDEIECGNRFHFPPSSGGSKPDKPMSFPFNDIRKGVNDICCNRSQAILLVERMNRVADKMNGADIAGIITMANSFRHKCSQCLNQGCPHRDPDFPFEAVQKRTKFFDEKGVPIELVTVAES